VKKLIVLIVVLSIAGYFGYPYYEVYKISSQPTFISLEKDKKIKVTDSISISDFSVLLEENEIIDSKEDFVTLATYKGYDSKIIPSGNFKILKEWSTYNSLLNNLYVYANPAGNRRIVNVVINNVRTIEDVARVVSKQIDADSISLSDLFNNDSLIAHYGFTKEVFPTFFMPNTYECYSDISPEQFLQKLADSYKSFWNQSRTQKASDIGLSQSEVTILASIVYEEQKVKFDEQAKIAGLYINRLKNGWKLQADPTVKYAVGDFTLRRILYKHLEVESPYNTYKNEGLPPGPISIPEPQTIDAVLNYELHEYFFMCAKPEYTGYHNFSKTLQQHNVYASEYKKWLTQQNIR
jgi:UPF0755 protein